VSKKPPYKSKPKVPKREHSNSNVTKKERAKKEKRKKKKEKKTQ
jgi:hypothetical protein